MPRPSNFPKDSEGSYLTLSFLKNMKNGEYVQIYWVKTDVMHQFIPSNIKQDGPSANLDEYTTRIYFKQQKNVTVGFCYNINGLQRTIELKHLKEVTERFLVASMRPMSFVPIHLFV